MERLVKLLQARLGDRLISVVVYGSVARGTARKDSDIDLLVVAEGLPKSRMKRQQIFLEVEEGLNSVVEELWSKGVHVDFSPIMLTPEEASKIRPVYLDMVEDAVVLYDKDMFFETILERLRKRLKELGAKRIWVGDKWYWMLKPDIRFGEVVEIE
ncbi:nucleotidyltransferase domain-containing protein [Candidatus Bathyarchaeota archaeon]|nr:MAG: nucleotidyltransferase domain-containing protein [Candidatus Bathyarchaeota archaeon]